MFNNITNFLNLITERKIKTAATLSGTDFIPLGTRSSAVDYGYTPTAITVAEFIASIPVPPLGVQSVTSNVTGALVVDQTDPQNPVINFNGVIVDNSTVTGAGILGNPLVAAYQAPAVDGTTITGDGTPGNPLSATSSAVNYANVIFVDSTNGNDLTGAVNNFTKPMATINGALALATTLTRSATSKALVYIRKGTYGIGTQVSPTTLVDYADVYCEPGVVISGVTGRISDVNSPAPVNVNFFGYADLLQCDLYIAKGSTVNFQVNNLITDSAVFLIIPASGTATVNITANKLYGQGLGTAYGGTIRNNSNVVFNITESYRATSANFVFINHSGKVVINCPKLALAPGDPYGYGGNNKCIVQIRANLGGEVIVNGDMINEDTGYLGGVSALISRTQDSWGTLRVNGNLYAGDLFGINAIGSSGASRTIINGDVRSNHLIAFIASNSNVVFRNGTLMNWNALVGVSEGYPVMSVAQSSKVWIENCHLYSLGLGATYPNIAAVWKDSTTSQLCINNSIHSGADAPGFFVRNSTVGQPVNNVRIHNCRSSKPLDTNIVDLLVPTGFIQDANTIAIGFI